MGFSLAGFVSRFGGFGFSFLPKGGFGGVGTEDIGEKISTHQQDADERFRPSTTRGEKTPRGRFYPGVGKDPFHTHIIDGRVEHAILLEIFTDVGIGTQITRKP